MVFCCDYIIEVVRVRSFLFNCCTSFLLIFLFFLLFLFLLRTILQMFLQKNLRKHLFTKFARHQIQSHLLLSISLIPIHFVHINFLIFIIIFFYRFYRGSEILGSCFPVISSFLETFCFAELIFLFLFHLLDNVCLC